MGMYAIEEWNGMDGVGKLEVVSDPIICNLLGILQYGSRDIEVVAG